VVVPDVASDGRSAGRTGTGRVRGGSDGCVTTGWADPPAAMDGAVRECTVVTTVGRTSGTTPGTIRSTTPASTGTARARMAWTAESDASAGESSAEVTVDTTARRGAVELATGAATARTGTAAGGAGAGVGDTGNEAAPAGWARAAHIASPAITPPAPTPSTMAGRQRFR